MEVRPEEDARGVGEAGRGRGQAAAGGVEAGELGPVHRVGGVLGAGEVAHDEAEVEEAEAGGRGGEGVELGGVEAHARHARVELDRGRQALLAAAGVGDPGVDLAEGVEDRGDAAGGGFGLGAGGEAVEDVERGGGRNVRAERDRLVEVGDEEGAAAFVGEHGGDAGGAEAVGVGLDHAGGGGAAEAGAERAVVRPDRPEVDLEKRACVAGFNLVHVRLRSVANP